MSYILFASRCSISLCFFGINVHAQVTRKAKRNYTKKKYMENKARKRLGWIGKDTTTDLYCYDNGKVSLKWANSESLPTGSRHRPTSSEITFCGFFYSPYNYSEGHGRYIASRMYHRGSRFVKSQKRILSRHRDYSISNRTYLHIFNDRLDYPGECINVISEKRLRTKMSNKLCRNVC